MILLKRRYYETKKLILTSISIIFLIFFIIKFYFSSTKPIKYDVLEFNQNNNKVKICDYTVDTKHKEYMYADLIFNLEKGKIIWQFSDPKGFKKFEGYVEKTNNGIIKKITYPEDLGNLNKEISLTGSEVVEFIPIAYFDNINYKYENLHSGKYEFKIQPLDNTLGSVKINWYNKMNKNKFTNFQKR